MNKTKDSNGKTGGGFADATGSARTVQRISKFLRVVSDDSMPDERGVMSNDNKLIAIIGYYKPWREYVLYPQPNTVWSNECLSAIKAHLKWMSGLTKYYEPNDQALPQPADNNGNKMTLRGDMTIRDLVKLGIKEICISPPNVPLPDGWFGSKPMRLYPHKCKRCKCKFSNNQKDCDFCCACEIRNIRDEWDESPNSKLTDAGTKDHEST